MKLTYCSIFMLLTAGVFSQESRAAEKESVPSTQRSAPHLGHLSLGLGKLAVSCLCTYMGVKTLAYTPENVKVNAFVGALTSYQQAINDRGYFNGLFQEDSSQLATHTIAPFGLMSVASMAFYGAYRALRSANQSFSKVYTVEAPMPELKKEEVTEQSSQ
ncbi:hypothetical protein H0W26_01295 [Candidatus Dependentiae bacterium]|nr:hypothetical protein [Candidatus Dependentiae bacterium]